MFPPSGTRKNDEAIQGFDQTAHWITKVCGMVRSLFHFVNFRERLREREGHVNCRKGIIIKVPSRGGVRGGFSSTKFISIILYFLFLFGCAGSTETEAPEEVSVVSGSTMGTYYRVSLASIPAQVSLPDLKVDIDGLLTEINAQMSTYLPDSELSRFNKFAETDWFPVSLETALVVIEGLRIYELSGGVFDITVGPLVNLWGFGPGGGRDGVPAESEIEEAKRNVGSVHLEARPSPPALRKDVTGLYVDLSAIAKGFAVDRIADFLDSRGIRGFLVDIGGEFRAKGRKSDGSFWKVAIEKPVIGERAVQRILHLTDRAVATSGDYRNYFEIDGLRYSHEINPVSGKPVAHRLASVTVLDDTCMRADALATALMVLGPDGGYELALKEKIAALFIVKGEKGFHEKMTPLFRDDT